MMTSGSQRLGAEELALLRHRLLLDAPSHPGRDEYIRGILDSFAAVRRLVSSSDVDIGSSDAFSGQHPGLYRSYLRLEVSSLIRLGDAALTARSVPVGGRAASLQRALSHLKAAHLELADDTDDE